MVSTFEPSERTERAFALMETVRLIVTQTLAPKIGGGRVALREYMEFTEDRREELLSTSFDKWPVQLADMVAQHGKTMARSAKDAYEAGLIDKRHYIIYIAGTKEGKQIEAELAEEAAQALAGGHPH
jgi:defect-in-organelle-trafficking protein DotB